MNKIGNHPANSTLQATRFGGFYIRTTICRFQLILSGGFARMGTPEWNIVDSDEIFPERTFIEKGITMKKVFIVVGVLFLGCVLGVASVQAKDPEKISIGQCKVIKYSEKVYWFFSALTDQSRDNFAFALVELIGQKDIEGYEAAAVTAHQTHQTAGYWVIFKKKPSFPPSQDVSLFPQLDHPFFKGW